MENHVYTLTVDDSLDGKFRELKSRFRPGEKIVDTKISGNKMIVITESPARVRGQSRNLLLDDMKAGKLKKFGQKAELWKLGS